MDNRYYKILKKPSLLFFTIAHRGLLNWMNDETFIKISYRILVGKRLNLNDPHSYNEKIQWLKLHDRNPLHTMMVDKYEVKKYVADLIGEEYVIKTLGVWDKFEDINFDSLPNQFVLKVTHNSGGVIICKDKTTLDIKEAKKTLDYALKHNYYREMREWPYKDVKPRLIAEAYLTDDGEGLKDYKFFCFDGKPLYVQVDYDRFKGHKRNIYDTEWNYLDLQIQYPTDKDHVIEKPANFEKMLELTGELSKGMKHARIDFYNVNGNIYFGEITFYHGSGFEKFTPESWNDLFGSKIKIISL